MRLPRSTHPPSWLAQSDFLGFSSHIWAGRGGRWIRSHMGGCQVVPSDVQRHAYKYVAKCIYESKQLRRLSIYKPSRSAFHRASYDTAI